MNSQKTIIVVEDDSAAASAMKALLEVNGFDVQTYPSAEDFVCAYRGEPIGCLVLDIRLPGMNGLELQREITDRNWHLPIVMISGHADEQARVLAMKNGATAFLLKPFSGSSLRDAIHTAIDFDSPVESPKCPNS